MYAFRLEAIWRYAAFLPSAIAATLLISGLAVVGGSLLGLCLAKIRLKGRRPLRFAATAYIEVFRNIPVIVLLYFNFFALAQMGFRMSGFWAAVLALTLNSSAYLAEIFRSGYMTVGPGQYEAARSLGLSWFATEIKVVFPQVMRSIIPPYANQCIGVLIGSSIAAVIGVRELGDWMLTTGSSSFRYMESFLVAAVIYVVLCQLIAALASHTERRLTRRLRN